MSVTILDLLCPKPASLRFWPWALPLLLTCCQCSSAAKLLENVAGQGFRYASCSTMTGIITGIMTGIMLISSSLTGMRFHVPPDADNNTLVSTSCFHLRAPTVSIGVGHPHTLDLYLHTVPGRTMEGTIPTNDSICRRSEHDTDCLFGRRLSDSLSPSSSCHLGHLCRCLLGLGLCSSLRGTPARRCLQQ